jgi:3D (Asp-Asp-Asp) domain-containing protein
MVEYCHQSYTFSRILSAVCLTTVFQFAACAQASQELKPEAKAEIKETVSTKAPSQVAIVEATQTITSTDNVADVPVCEPKVTLSQPTLDIAVKPHEQKLVAAKFEAPEKDSQHAPRKFKASAYSIHGRTRSGTVTQPGTIAADTRVLPLGTVVQVNAGKYSGVYTVHDTGGAIKGNRLDVWLPSNKEARRFGRREVKLVVLKYPGQNASAPKTVK